MTHFLTHTHTESCNDTSRHAASSNAAYSDIVDALTYFNNPTPPRTPRNKTQQADIQCFINCQPSEFLSFIGGVFGLGRFWLRPIFNSIQIFAILLFLRFQSVRNLTLGKCRFLSLPYLVVDASLTGSLPDVMAAFNGLFWSVVLYFRIFNKLYKSCLTNKIYQDEKSI